MSKSKKKIITYIILFLLCFNIATDFKRKEVQADALGVAIGGLMLDGSLATGAIVASAPYIVGFALICISLGIVYKNREEIQAAFVSAYNYAKSQGKNLLDYFSTSSDGKVTVKKEGLDIITSAIKDYKINSDSLNMVGNIGTYSFSEGTYSKPTGVNISVPLSGSDMFIFKITGTPLSGSLQPLAEVLIDGVNLHYITDVFTSEPLWLALDYSSSGWKYYRSWVSEADLRSKIASNSSFLTGSICADFSIKVKQSTSGSGSISVDRLLGDSIGNVDSVADIPAFHNPSISLDKDVSISIPTDTTWDYVIDKTYDNVTDITNEGAIPNEGNPSLDPPSKTLDLSPLYIDLSKKFPFCIPWDIYNLFSSLNVNKQRPVYKANLNFGSLGSHKVDVDLAFFDDYLPLSSILRYFLLIAFIYALMKNTRKFIGG